MALFLAGVSLGILCGALAVILFMFHEPKSKELTKEQWKAGYRQK